MEFEWKIFPGFTAVAILNEIQQMTKSTQREPWHLAAESSSSQCIFMTLYGEKTETQKNVFRILLKFRSMLAGFLAVVGHSCDLDQKRNGTRHVLINQTEIGTKLQKL